MSATGTEQPAVRSDRTRVVPWGLWALIVVTSVAAGVVTLATAATRDAVESISYAVGAIWASTAGLVGALIASRRRDNRIGWLMIAVGLLVVFMVFASVASEGEHPAADAMNILSDLGWVLFVVVFSLFILLFPDGRPLTARWRPAVWFVALWPSVTAAVTLVVAPHDLLLDAPISLSRTITGVLLLITLVVLGVSAVLRYARSSGTERRQLKWFAYLTAIGLGFAIVGNVLPVWGGILASLGLFGPLAGVAIALFRHRLYDIDQLISRTFIYGALVAILAGVYTASIRLFNAVFDRMTGLGSEEALVITTLILATTFTPIKKRLEELVEARYKTPSERGPGTTGERPDGVSVPADLETRLRSIVREELERASRT